MKKSILLFAIALSVSYSCTQENVTATNEEDIITLWSNADSDTRNYEGNSVESYVAVIQKIKAKHPIAKDFLAELKKYGYKESDLDLDNITRTIMTKSSAVALSVPNKTNGEMVMAYLYKKTYCVIRGVQEGGEYNFSTIDNVPMCSVETDGTSFAFVGAKTVNAKINEFSDFVYKEESKEAKSDSMTRGGARTTWAECCRREAGFQDCVSCTHSYFGIPRNYAAQAAMWVFAWELMGALAGSCIGAGPNTFC